MGNKKQHRTDGVINSSEIRFPSSMKSFNTPTSEYSYTRGEHASKTSSQNPVKILKRKAKCLSF